MRAGVGVAIALVVAAAVSLQGNGVTQIALPWAMLQRGSTSTSIGIIAAAASAGVIAGSALAGFVVRRIGAFSASFRADLCAGASLVILAYCSSKAPVAIIALFAALASALDTVASTSRRSLVLPTAEASGVALDRLNGALATAEGAAPLLGPIVAATIIASQGSGVALTLDALSFVLAAALIFGVRQAKSSSTPTHGSVREGALHLWRTPILFRSVLAATLINALQLPLLAVVLPTWVHNVGRPVTDLGVLSSSLGAGLLLGALAWSVLYARVSRAVAFRFGVGASGLALLGLLLPGGLWVHALALGLAGFCLGPMNPIADAWCQLYTPIALQADVLGLVVASVTVAVPLGSLAMGLLLERIAPQTLIVAVALGSVLVGFGTRLRENATPARSE